MDQTGVLLASVQALTGSSWTIFYRITSSKAAATDPLWNPSIAGRELLKPKFYDVWLEVSGKNQAIVTKTKTKSSTEKGERYPRELLKGESSRSLGKDGQPAKQRVKDSSSAMKEMQRLMLVQLQVNNCTTGLQFEI